MIADAQTVTARGKDSWKTLLQSYHPIAIEGPGPSNDKRDPNDVADQLYKQLLSHWRRRRDNIQKSVAYDRPKLILTQGDPTAATGVAAISMEIFRRLAEETNSASTGVMQSALSEASTKRALVTLDDPEHIAYADRQDIFIELRLSQLVDFLMNEDEGSKGEVGPQADHCNVTNKELSSKCQSNIPNCIETMIDLRILSLTEQAQNMNTRANAENQNILPNTQITAPRSSTKQYAYLQETTKAAFRKLCGEITVIQTIPRSDIPVSSVTGFFPVGIELGLMSEDDYLAYDGEHLHDGNKMSHGGDSPN